MFVPLSDSPEPYSSSNIDFPVSIGLTMDKQLALKHRINKRLEQRVICFVGSPVSETPEELTSLGTRMKKNKVAIDIVSFGEVAENEVKLQALVNAANSGDNSHYTGVATKPYVNLMDELTGSAVFGASMAMAGSAMDDDLETAIRLSLAEQGGGAAAGGAAAGGAAPRNQMAVDDVDDEMAAAIRMSMAGAAPEPGTENNNQAGAGAGDIDEDLELAIQLSMQDNMDVDEPAPTPAAEEPKKKEEETAAPKEEESTGATMQSLMESIGVDPNDPNFQQLMADLDKEKESEEKRDDKSKK